MHHRQKKGRKKRRRTECRGRIATIGGLLTPREAPRFVDALAGKEHSEGGRPAPPIQD